MRIGLVVPSANTITEEEFQRTFRGDPPVHTARMFLESGTWAAEKAMLEEHLPAALRDLGSVRCDTIVFACTSGGAASGRAGEDRLITTITSGTGAARVVSANRSSLESITARGWERVALVTPYRTELADVVAAGLADAGVTVGIRADMGILGAEAIGAVGADEVERFVEEALAASDESVDGVFVSCNNLRAAHLSGRPTRGGHEVLTSNSVLIEQVQRLLDAPVQPQVAATG